MVKTESDSGKIRHCFPKSEKLCSKKDMEELFKKGSSHFLYPFKLVFLTKKTKECLLPQVLITVPKKTFKKAVDRNRIKRQIREAYRLSKDQIFGELNAEKIPCYIAIIYIGKDKLQYNELEKKLISILLRLKN
jgi:ribonuclease P protein component